MSPSRRVSLLYVGRRINSKDIHLITQALQNCVILQPPQTLY
jgi:hypothetical protein